MTKHFYEYVYLNPGFDQVRSLGVRVPNLEITNDPKWPFFSKEIHYILSLNFVTNLENQILFL